MAIASFKSKECNFPIYKKNKSSNQTSFVEKYLLLRKYLHKYDFKKSFAIIESPFCYMKIHFMLQRKIIMLIICNLSNLQTTTMQFRKTKMHYFFLSVSSSDV